jgi:NADH:ubiquinone oxidoreductase subunit F (NADH-binding)
MNSRDAAYDEDEMLRRAIEESRETGSLGKRTRDESEEYDSTITNDGQHY